MTLWKNWFSRMQQEVPAVWSDGGQSSPQVDLSRLDSLTAPFERDSSGQPMPPPSPEAIRQSLALAEMTYTLDITPWLAAGWRDFSFQIDNVLESGSQSSVQTSGDIAFLQLAELRRMRRAQTALRARNPVGQVLAALRQREGSDTVKAVCMAHPLPEGKHLIAIGFMGTGKRFYDWFSNFRFSDEAGFHQGFFQLCKHFEEGLHQLAFPATAAALGLEKLSLHDILTELQSPDSRFQLWMAGHSQGGAVMQVFTHRLMHHRGVLARHLRGFGFASPTAASAALTDKPFAYPLWHIQNRDDLVCRIGAQVHLGQCLEFTPDEAFRQRAYPAPSLPADAACRRWLKPILYNVRDTADNLLSVTALMLCAAEEKGEDALNLLMDRGRSLAVLDWLYAFAGDRAQSAVKQLEAHQRRTYRELTGREMDDQQLKLRMEKWRPHVAVTSLRRILTGLAACLTQPHMLNEDDPAKPGAYRLIVNHHLHRLRPFRWEMRTGGEPVKHYIACGQWLRRADRAFPGNGEMQVRITGRRRSPQPMGKERLRVRR